MSNINFVIYDGFGNILQGGNCPEEVLSLQTHPLGDNILEGDGTHDKHYVINNSIVAYTDVELQAKNNLSSGWIWQMPERVAVDKRALADAQIECWEKIKTIRSEKESDPFVCDESTYDTNKINIAGAVQMAMIAKSAEQPFTIEWILHDNTTKTLNADQMIAVGIAQGQMVSNIYDIANGIRDNINKSTTISKVDAITWPA